MKNSERVTKLFERLIKNSEWVTKPFKRLIQNSERVTKPYKRLINDWMGDLNVQTAHEIFNKLDNYKSFLFISNGAIPLHISLKNSFERMVNVNLFSICSDVFSSFYTKQMPKFWFLTVPDTFSNCMLR